MKRLPLGPLYYEFSRHNEPRLRIEPGETIVVESEDAFSGQIRTNADRRDKTKKPYGNPQTGPIWVEGAEPGDALAVTIQEIRPVHRPVCDANQRPQAACRVAGDRVPARHARLPDQGRQNHWSDEIDDPLSRRCSAASAPRRTSACRRRSPPARTAATWTSSRRARQHRLPARVRAAAPTSIWATPTPRWGTASYRPAVWRCRPKRPSPSTC